MTQHIAQSDGYLTTTQAWGVADAATAVLFLHGAMSHGGWQQGLGDAIASRDEGVRLVAMDRRGCGANAMRGISHSVAREIRDVIRVAELLRPAHERLVIMGWCFGAEVALMASHVAPDLLLDLLLLLNPSLAFSQLHAAVLQATVEAVDSMLKQFNLVPEETKRFVPVGIPAHMFSDVPLTQRMIEDDPLALRLVTRGTALQWSRMRAAVSGMLAHYHGAPVSCLLADRDRVIDVNATRRQLRQVCSAQDIVLEPGSPGLHLDEPERVTDWIKSKLA